MDEAIQRSSIQISLLPRRLNFNDSNESSPSHNNTNLPESPKTPPNHGQLIPPMTPACRKHRPSIPLRFAEHLASPSKADSPQKDEISYSPPIKRICLLKLEEGIYERSHTSLKCSRIYEHKTAHNSFNDSGLPKVKQFSINPFSPAATDLRSKWMNNNNCSKNNYNNNNEPSLSDSWAKDLTNIELSDLEVSRYFKEFKIDKLIGKGDFGEVYKCINILEGMPYAIKKTLKKVVGTRRENYARKEVYANAALFSHPNIVAYHSAWNESNSVFIQFEYCDGGNLEDLIFTKNHKFNDGALERLLSHLASGLHYMHMSKMVHLDIKPANIMISHFPHSKEDEEKVDRDIIYKIGDLGHVAHLDSLCDVEDGDARYLPKEMLSGKYDSSTITKVDIFSLGMTAYEAISGSRLPSDGPEWHYLRDGFVPDIDGFRLSLLLANMIDPLPLNRPNAIDVFKNVTFKATELAELSTIQYKRDYLASCSTTKSTQCSPIKKIGLIPKRAPVALNTLHKRRLVGHKSQRYSSF
ncbi:wee1-like protein kinase [Daktulosphaira vitifoliae]|uniref:wee1-like protein kinase n=1 Tax=Daktulosphaira vitifoliae TaxID=58002 RepID=UPI0021AAE331|nr:wee1-like protein kinase [Daktulosphaira vitifoliae]